MICGVCKIDKHCVYFQSKHIPMKILKCGKCIRYHAEPLWILNAKREMLEANEKSTEHLNSEITCLPERSYIKYEDR